MLIKTVDVFKKSIETLNETQQPAKFSNQPVINLQQIISRLKSG
jgi:hypothetical protein